MGQRGALGRTGRAAGELHVDRVMAVQLCRDGIQRCPRHARAARNHIGIAEHPGCMVVAHADDTAQCRQARRLQFARRAGGQFGGEYLEHLQVP
ncbi:hypothetical protein FQZ97_1230700 [compost metagenome]